MLGIHDPVLLGNLPRAALALRVLARCASGRRALARRAFLFSFPGNGCSWYGVLETTAPFLEPFSI